MSPIMNSSEKRPDAPPSWRQDDLESFEAEPRQDVKSSRRLKLTIIAGFILFFVFLFNGKTPLHLKRCAHHITKHLHAGSLAQEDDSARDGIRHQARDLSHATPLDLQKRQANSSVCNTPFCQSFAHTIKGNLAKNYTSIDPCKDFSSYACDGWRGSHDYRPDQSSVSVGSIMADVNRNLLHAVLEGSYADNSTFSAANRTFDRANFDKMKVVYNACMNEDAIKARGVTPLRPILDGFEKIYPLNGTSNAKGSNVELTNTLVWLSRHGVSGLIRNGRKADDKAPDVVVLSFGGGQVQLSKQYYNKSIVLANYTRAIAEMTQVITSGKTILEEPIPASRNASLFAEAKKIVDFEKVLSDHMPEPDQLSNITYYYQVFPITYLDKLVPEISTTNYLKAQAPSGYPIDSNRTAIIGDINYYRALSKIIQATPRDTLHAYFKWRLMGAYQMRLHKDFTLPMRQFGNRLSGRDANTVSDRWRICLSELDSGLSNLYSAAFIERAFTSKDKDLGDRIIHDIKTVFSERLKGFDWMSDKSKNIAAKKVVNIIQKIGYQTKSPNDADPKDLHDYYASMNTSSDYFNNELEYLKFGYTKSWNDLLKPVDRNRWGMSAPTVNAYFSPSGNEIVFPAGIMQLPVFSSKLPEYISYGSFGAVAGHELTHGFDNHGSQYDENGVLNSWWDNKTTTQFDKKTQCFVDQYSKFSVPGLDAGEVVHVNGKLTLGENIADAGGLTAAYTAWKKRDTANPGQKLPGLEMFSNDQMFFISYSNWWCGKVRKEQALSYVYSDPHSPADKRITGTTNNSAAFKKAFNCPVKTPQCEVW